MVRRRGDDLGKVPREGLHFTVHESKWKFIHSYKGFFAIHVLEFIVSKTKSCWIYFYRLCLLSNYTRRPSCFSFSLFLFFLFCIRSFGLVMKRTGEETSTVSSPHTWPGLPYTVAWWKIFSQSGAMAAHIQKRWNLLLTLRETAPEDRVAVGNNRWYKLREDPCSVSWTNLKSLLLMRCTKCSFRPHGHQFEVLHGKGLEAGEWQQADQD